MTTPRRSTTARSVLKAVTAAFRNSAPMREVGRTAATVHIRDDAIASPGQLGDSATHRIAPPAPSGLRLTYAPDRDGDPDAGEVVWTWVPYDENDGRGKDRPVLVIGRQNVERVFAVRLTSTPHDGDRDFVSIGPGEWDSRGRSSWLDVEQVYSIHIDGMRREAAILDPKRFFRVAQALQQRYGWVAGE